MKKLERNFYDRSAVDVARDLLGKLLVHDVDGIRYSARIVETEAYCGITDKAAHSYGGRRTERVEVMYGKPGFSYVYFVYGMHFCFNVVSSSKDDPQAVLVRGVEPVEGLDMMAYNRFHMDYAALSCTQKVSLTNGPAKLCKALALDRRHNGLDLCGSSLFIVQGDVSPSSIVETTRIGIGYAEEAQDYPWRFYIAGNPYVSVK